MARGPEAIALRSSERERAESGRLARRRGAGQALVQRARVVLACAEPGATNAGVARALGVGRPSVATRRARFAAHRLDGLGGAPRPGAPRQVGDDRIERLIALTLEAQPEGATHRSTRAVAKRAGMSRTTAKRAGMSRTTASRVWRAFGLQPHRQEASKLSTDPAFVGKVRDAVGLRMPPPDRALVPCVDEKPRIQAVERAAPVLPVRPGQPERHARDHRRHGTADLPAALDVKTGAVIGACEGRHRAVESRAFLDRVEALAPPDLDVHPVPDNAATHETKIIRNWLVKRPRRHLHFTPTSASWLNLAEGWFALLTRRRLQRGVFTSTADLGTAIRAYIGRTDAEPKPFIRTKPADTIPASVGRFCQRISNSDH